MVNKRNVSDPEKRTLILHIPHSSTSIPIKDGFVVDDWVLNNEILKLTDWYTDDLFCSQSDTSILAPFSRIFCDVERFQDDTREVMAGFGMGVVYQNTDKGETMRHVTPDLRERILVEYYTPHHKNLYDSVTDQLQRFSFATIVDCHSFPDVPLFRSLNKQTPRPDFNIGTDSYHTPEAYIDVSKTFFREKGYSLGIDWPYNGSIVPMEYYHQNKNVYSIMLEINRKLYLTENTNEKSGTYQEVKKVVQEYLSLIRSCPIHG